MSVSIRRASVEDKQACIDMNKKMAKETENIDLKDHILSPGCQTFLSDESKGIGFICEESQADLQVDGKVAGQIFITYEWSDWRNSNVWWIQSVYVKPEFRRIGAFRKMFEHVREEAKKAGAGALRLYVDNDNTKAQSTYAALGMTSHYKVFEEEFGKL